MDKPGLGENLQDHLQLRLIFKAQRREDAQQTLQVAVRRAAWWPDYALRRRGPLTMAPSQVGAVHALRSERDARQSSSFMCSRSRSTSSADPLHTFPAFTTSVCNLQPTSRGPVRLRSTDPSDNAGHQARTTCRPRRIASRDRLDPASRGRSCRSRRWRRFHPDEYLPGPRCARRRGRDRVKAAGDIGTTIFHPVGTAKMGCPEDLPPWSTNDYA